MPIIVLVVSVIMCSVNSSAMMTKLTRNFSHTRAFYYSIPQRDTPVSNLESNQNSWNATRKNFLDARTGKNHVILYEQMHSKSKLLNRHDDDEDPLSKMKQDIKDIFSGTKTSDLVVDAGAIARNELEKYEHIEPDMGTRWQACQLTAMGLYLLKKIYGGKYSDDIAVALYLLQIDKKDQIREKIYMVRALKELGIYDYIANNQHERNDIHAETISFGQYNNLLIYLRSKLQKLILDAIYDSSDQDFESYALLERNSEYVPKNREEAFSKVIEKLEQEKTPIVLALYPGTPSQSEVRTLQGTGFIYLYRFSDNKSDWELVSPEEWKIKKPNIADNNGYFIIHAGLAQYGINAQKFIKENSVEVLTPQIINIDLIELIKHRFNLVNSSSSDFQPEDINKWPHPDLSVFHFSFRIRPIKDLQRAVSEREVAYCRLARNGDENMQLHLSLIDFECESSTPFFVEENVQDYYAKDPENTPRKQRIFNKPGVFIYKTKNYHKLILRIVPNHPESSYFVVRKMYFFDRHRKKGERTAHEMLWDNHSIREAFESFLKLLLVYHDKHLCPVMRIILNRNELTKEAIEKHLEDIEYIQGKSNRPFEKCHFLKMYISKKNDREWSFTSSQK